MVIESLILLFLWSSCVVLEKESKTGVLDCLAGGGEWAETVGNVGSNASQHDITPCGTQK